jgi:hypothetical protein
MTILVGIDDTDVLGARGTNQLARALAAQVAERWHCRRILRHQLLVDSRIPSTSRNGSASLAFEPRDGSGADALRDEIRRGMLSDFVDGSDPGLCVATRVPNEVVVFAQRCRREVVSADEARAVARANGVHLEGLGGTEGGVIGALAAVGLAATGDHGRVVMNGKWNVDLTGVVSVREVLARGVDSVVELATGYEVSDGTVDVLDKLGPNRRAGHTVLFVERSPEGEWRALRCD